MKTLKMASQYVLATVVAAVSLAACVAPTGEESIGESADPIINGTPQFLGQNSFVRLASTGCTGTLISNSWILTANHCAPAIGATVTMDNQVGTVARVVPNPDVGGGVDIALLKLSAPMLVAGTTTSFRRGLRTTVALPGTHIRCFGYGWDVNATGTTPQLRLMELGTAGGANSVYFLEQNALGQSAAPGDAGGACLDDTGAALAVMRSFTWSPTAPGETAAITSQYYASWAASVLSSCTANSDCSTGICNVVTQQCVSSTCQDGVQDSGETGVDCGGSCVSCRQCPIGTTDCEGDGTVCIKRGMSCP